MTRDVKQRDIAAEIRAATTLVGMRATARIHADGDAKFGRDWLTGGCCCGACRIVRREVAIEAVRVAWAARAKAHKSLELTKLAHKLPEARGRYLDADAAYRAAAASRDRICGTVNP